MVYVFRLRWDAWNIAHIARHDVAPDEVEEVCAGNPLFESGYKGRLRLVGSTTDGRVLAIILDPEKNAIYYPITARPASRKERKRYLELKGD